MTFFDDNSIARVLLVSEAPHYSGDDSHDHSHSHGCMHQVLTYLGIFGITLQSLMAILNAPNHSGVDNTTSISRGKNATFFNETGQCTQPGSAWIDFHDNDPYFIKSFFVVMSLFMLATLMKHMTNHFHGSEADRKKGPLHWLVFILSASPFAATTYGTFNAVDPCRIFAAQPPYPTAKVVAASFAAVNFFFSGYFFTPGIMDLVSNWSECGPMSMAKTLGINISNKKTSCRDRLNFLALFSTIFLTTTSAYLGIADFSSSEINSFMLAAACNLFDSGIHALGITFVCAHRAEIWSLFIELPYKKRLTVVLMAVAHAAMAVISLLTILNNSGKINYPEFILTLVAIVAEISAAAFDAVLHEVYHYFGLENLQAFINKSDSGKGLGAEGHFHTGQPCLIKDSGAESVFPTQPGC